jgi:Rrf2 family protein
MFSKTAEYALRVMVWLAGQDGTARKTREIAAATRVPAGYLSKILQTLTRGGLVVSQRGTGGGFTMSSAPTEVTPLDVVNTVDPLRRITACPLGLESHSDRLCPIHGKLDAALAGIEDILSGVTLADLATGASDAPFCDH